MNGAIYQPIPLNATKIRTMSLNGRDPGSCPSLRGKRVSDMIQGHPRRLCSPAKVPDGSSSAHRSLLPDFVFQRIEQQLTDLIDPACV